MHECGGLVALIGGRAGMESDWWVWLGGGAVLTPFLLHDVRGWKS